ncbi:MAG: hypothetical protein HYY61_05995, partial [Deltaproteobacteria bacterium]|nr:hypothetical protein [Deltaproteobacteria bacterium]
KISPQGRSSEREVYLNKIQDLFGFSDPEIFKNSLFIEQRSLHLPPPSETRAELKQLISNISEFKYDEIITRLEERYFELTKKNPKGTDKRNDRLLEELQKQVMELDQRIEKARKGQESLRKISEKMGCLKEALSTKEQRLKILTQSISAREQLLKLFRKEAEVKDSLSELQKRKSLVERLTEQLKTIQKTKPQMNRLAIGFLVAAFFTLPLVFFSAHIGILWLIFLFIGVCLFLGYTIYQQKQTAQRYELQETRIRSQLEVLPDIKKLDFSIQHHQKSLFEMDSQKIELERAVIEGNKSLPEHQAEKETLIQEIQDMKETYTEEKQNTLFLSKGLESPFTLEEDLFDLKQKEKNLKIKAHALWTAKEMLTQMVIEFRKEHLKLFAQDTESLFHKISSDTYEHFSFDEEFLVPSLRWQNMASPVSTSSLSCGTQDQLYFAMKLSLLKLLNSDRQLPLFLDDPFVNFDHERRVKVLEFLKICATEHQIFLFTYDEWYAEYLQNCNVIKLNESK